MKVASGTFNGTGAAVYICCGFVPDEVQVIALEDDHGANAYWSRQYRAADADEGYLDTNGATALVLYTAGTGIAPYFGGDLMTSTNQTSVAYGEGVYLAYDDTNYARMTPDGDGASSVIDTWTLGSSANRTGNFNDDNVATGNHTGEGSVVIINGRKYIVEAWTAGQGVAANEVTLNQAAASGPVGYISGMYSMAPIALGRVSPAGFLFSATTHVNVNNEIQYFKAISYDD